MNHKLFLNRWQTFLKINKASNVNLPVGILCLNNGKVLINWSKSGNTATTFNDIQEAFNDINKFIDGYSMYRGSFSPMDSLVSQTIIYNNKYVRYGETSL